MKTNDLIEVLGYQYVTELIPAEQGGGYNLYIPAFGEYTCRAVGDSKDEAYNNLCIILQEVIELYRERNIPLPPIGQMNEDVEPISEYSGRTVLRMPKETHKRLSLAAKRNDVSLNTYLLSLIERNNALDEVKEIMLNSNKDRNLQVEKSGSFYNYEETKVHPFWNMEVLSA